MVNYALSFLAGLVLVQQLKVLPEIQWLIIFGIGACIIAWLRYWRGVFFMLGVLWAVLFAMHRLSCQLPQQLEGVETQITGTVASLPEQDEKRTRFDFVTQETLHAKNPAKAALQLPRKLRLSWYYPDQPIKAGQRWTFTVKLKRVHGTLNPGGFDYERWLFTEGIGTTGYVRPAPKPMLLGRDSAWNSIAVLRQTITDRFTITLGNNASLALIKALTLGDGNNISQRQWEVFRKTGTTHLVVISGSHIGLIAGLVYWLVLKGWAWTGWLKHSPQKIAAIAAILAGIFYAGLAGFSVPTQRSVIMLAIAMVAIILQRNTRPFNTLSTALFAVLLYDPLAVLAAGFWLSFLAVSLIVYAVSGRLGTLGAFWTAVKLHWVTSLGLSPLLLLFFQQVSLIAPLANLIAVPIISLLAVPLALLATLILFIWPMAATALFSLADALLQGLWWLLSHLAELPMASINHPSPSYWALVFAVPGILLLLAPMGMPARWLSLVLFLPLVFTDAKQPKTGNINMTLLDVGQGLSVVVETRHHLLVYDTGAKCSAQSDMGQSVLLPFLHGQGFSQIDTLIISHGDNDHIGGAVSLMTGISTKKLLTSVPGQLSGYAPIKCQAGQSWRWDEVKFTLLSPKQAFDSDNDNSCVLKIESKHGSVLLTGDIEAKAESWLARTYGNALKADITVAPHHGSKTSSTAGFLEAVQARYMLIPAGYRNPFGHPHKDVLARYQHAHAEWLNTADSGAVVVKIKNNAWDVHGVRETEGRYWNH